ncbi:hypothetical protein [Pseudomonas mosselii]|uniref:hypothetical protein n=1 Tax=Pseudomonas mosselii TaxID=78327 RepID=UPI001F4BDB9C|nr:hypothetical protein [Pseudomonas mosselii]MCH7420696.1 hypothetical protein [Pseudomonas mosselii]
MKGLHKKIIAGVIAALGLVVAGLINYVVEHGELPAWSSGVLSWLSSLMLIQTPWAFWEILLILLGPCAVLVVLIFILWQKNSVDVDDYNEQLVILRNTKAAYIKLKKEYSDLNDAHDKLAASVEEIKATNSDLASKNAELKKEIAEMLAAAVVAKKPEVNKTCLNVLKAIAALTERDLRADLDSIDSIVRLGKIQTHAALDVLKESDLISMSGNVRGMRYRLTAQGRVYYLEHQDH